MCSFSITGNTQTNSFSIQSNTGRVEDRKEKAFETKTVSTATSILPEDYVASMADE